MRQRAALWPLLAVPAGAAGSTLTTAIAAAVAGREADLALQPPGVGPARLTAGPRAAGAPGRQDRPAGRDPDPWDTVMAWRNDEIAANFSELAALYELRGGEGFRVRAYERAARALSGHGADLAA